MKFFKKMASKKISTTLNESDNRRSKSKYNENMSLPSSPPLLSKDDSLLRLNIPDGFSSFDIPQLQSIHTQSLSIENTGTIVQEVHTATNITAEDKATIYVEPFSKTEQGTGMHAEVNYSNASIVHTDISESHSELSLEFTENGTGSFPYLPIHGEGEKSNSPLLYGSTETTELDSVESTKPDNMLFIDTNIVSTTPIFTKILDICDVSLSSTKEDEHVHILPIETNQVLVKVHKEGKNLDSANNFSSQPSHQSSFVSQEIAKSSIPSHRNNDSDTDVIIEALVDQHNEKEPPALLQARYSGEDNITETIIENKEAANSHSITLSLDDQELQTLNNSIDAIEKDICAGNNSNVDASQKNISVTCRVTKRRPVYSLIPLKQQQPAVFNKVTTTLKFPVQTNRTQEVGKSRIPLPSKLSIIASPVSIQETLTAASSPSSSSGSHCKSTRSISTDSTSTSSDNIHHSQKQQPKRMGRRSPVYKYIPLIQSQSKIPIATFIPSTKMTKLAEILPTSNQISRLPKRNPTIA